MVLVQVLVLLMFMCAVPLCAGVVYKVGDETGWTTLGNYNYTKWAASKKFHVGDTILFVYHTEYHNVMQVSHADYKSCNVTSPIVTYKTGNDSIEINKTGHYYFTCGVPGHCLLGQKVDISVPGTSSSSVTPSPNGAPTMAPSPSPMTTMENTTTPSPLSPRSDAAKTPQVVPGMVALAWAVFVGFVAL